MNYNFTKFLLMLLIAAFCHGVVAAQQLSANSPITVNLSNSNALQLIRELAGQSAGYSFSYSGEKLERVKVDKIAFNHINLLDALKLIEKNRD